MKHKLINTEQEFKIFVNNLKYRNIFRTYKSFSKEELEGIFNIRFFRANGRVPVTTHNSFWKKEFYSKDIKYLEDDNDTEFEYPHTGDFIYHKDSIKPKSYPVIVVYYFGQDFDRYGDSCTQVIDYVYINEFKNWDIFW